MRRAPVKPPRRAPQGARRPAPGRAPRGTVPRLKRTVVLNIVFIIITAIAGFITWLIGNAINSALASAMPRPVLMGIEFSLLFIIIAVVVLVLSTVSGIFEDNIFTGSANLPVAIGAVLATALIVFGLAAFFQWIYQLNPQVKIMKDPTSYIFVIDESGSMYVNDPNNNREPAIESVMKDKADDFPYMVYGFASDSKIHRDMAPKSMQTGELEFKSDGGTAIRGVLERIIDDYKNKVWEGGDAPKLILLTDGSAGDISNDSSIDDLLKVYVDNNISISTVGLGRVDKSLMRTIAASTGGVFVDITDADDLSTALSSAAILKGGDDRTLLNARTMLKFSGLYGVLRVLFVTILGAVIGIAMIIPHGFPDSYPLIIITSAIKAFVGALILEVGTSLGASTKFMWALLWILLAATVTYKVGRSAINRSNRKF